MLGHKSATLTLDLYGHLFGARLDVVADAIDLAREASFHWMQGGCRIYSMLVRLGHAERPSVQRP